MNHVRDGSFLSLVQRHSITWYYSNGLELDSVSNGVNIRITGYQENVEFRMVNCGLGEISN